MSDSVEVRFIISEDSQMQPIPNQPFSNRVIVNPLMVFASKWIPNSLSFGVTIVTSGIDFDNEKNIQIILKNRQTSEPLYDTGVNKIKLDGAKPDNYTFSLDLKNIDITTEGYYDIILKIDEEQFTDHFKVVKRNDSK